MWYRLFVSLASFSALIPSILFLVKFRPPPEFKDVALSQRLLVSAMAALALNSGIAYGIALFTNPPLPSAGRIVITLALITVGVVASWAHYIVYLRRR